MKTHLKWKVSISQKIVFQCRVIFRMVRQISHRRKQKNWWFKHIMDLSKNHWYSTVRNDCRPIRATSYHLKTIIRKPQWIWLRTLLPNPRRSILHSAFSRATMSWTRSVVHEQTHWPRVQTKTFPSNSSSDLSPRTRRCLTYSTKSRITTWTMKIRHATNML